jgi:hypothetical protein
MQLLRQLDSSVQFIIVVCECLKIRLECQEPWGTLVRSKMQTYLSRPPFERKSNGSLFKSVFEQLIALPIRMQPRMRTRRNLTNRLLSADILDQCSMFLGCHQMWNTTPYTPHRNNCTCRLCLPHKIGLDRDLHNYHP